MPITKISNVKLKVKAYCTTNKRRWTEYVKVVNSKQQCTVSVSSDSWTTPGTVDNAVEESAPDTVASSSYSDKRRCDTDEWASVRNDLLRVAVELETPCTYICCLCQAATEEPIRCVDCNASFICCIACEEGHHKASLHRPEIWKVVFAI